MKSSLVIIMMLFSAAIMAQGDITAKMSKHLAAGNGDLIMAYFAPNVDLTIGDDEDVYAKDQAGKMLSRFFSQNTVKGFDLKHEGTSKLNDHYRIGELETSKGNFRVTYFMKVDKEKYTITQFRIEESDE